MVSGFKGNPDRVDFFWTTATDGISSTFGDFDVGGKFGSVATQTTPVRGTDQEPWSTLTFSVIVKETVAFSAMRCPAPDRGLDEPARSRRLAGARHEVGDDLVEPLDERDVALVLEEPGSVRRGRGVRASRRGRRAPSRPVVPARR